MAEYQFASILGNKKQPNTTRKRGLHGLTAARLLLRSQTKRKVWTTEIQRLHGIFQVITLLFRMPERFGSVPF